MELDVIADFSRARIVPQVLHLNVLNGKRPVCTRRWRFYGFRVCYHRDHVLCCRPIDYGRGIKDLPLSVYGKNSVCCVLLEFRCVAGACQDPNSSGFLGERSLQLYLISVQRELLPF